MVHRSRHGRLHSPPQPGVGVGRRFCSGLQALLRIRVLDDDQDVLLVCEAERCTRASFSITDGQAREGGMLWICFGSILGRMLANRRDAARQRGLTGGDHDLVLFASDAQECQVVLQRARRAQRFSDPEPRSWPPASPVWRVLPPPPAHSRPQRGNSSTSTSASVRRHLQCAQQLFCLGDPAQTAPFPLYTPR